MIQRIQSLYLLLIAIFSGLTIALPVAGFINTELNKVYIMDIHGISLIQGQTATLTNTTSLLTSFSAVFGIIALIVLFSYKNRMKQIRLSVMNFMFMIGYYLLFAYYSWSACSQFSASFHFKAGAILPLCCIILNYLAIGSIGKDEKLVKSTDRLR